MPAVLHALGLLSLFAWGTAAWAALPEEEALAAVATHLHSRVETVATFGSDKAIFHVDAADFEGKKVRVQVFRRPLCTKTPALCKAGERHHQTSVATSWGAQVVQVFSPYSSNAGEVGYMDKDVQGNELYGAVPPTPATIVWVLPFDEVFVRISMDFGWDDTQVTEEGAQALIDPLAKLVYDGLAGQGVRPTGDAAAAVPTVRLPNDCAGWGVKDEDFDWQISQAELRRSLLAMLREYPHKYGVNVRTASKKHGGYAPWHFAKLGAHLFTKSHEKVQTFSTADKDEQLGALVAKKYPNGDLSPAKLVEEALALNDHCLYDALLQCHNFVKRQSYALRQARELLGADEASYREGLERYDAMPDARKKSLSREEATRKSKEAVDDTQAKIAGNPLNRSFIPLRGGGDNEGAWYHLFGTMVQGYAERENLSTGVSDAVASWTGGDPNRGNVLSTLGVNAEHHGKNLYHRGSFDVADKAEHCFDRFGVDLGYELHRALPENQALIARRLDDYGKSLWMPFHSDQPGAERQATAADDFVDLMKKGFGSQPLF